MPLESPASAGDSFQPARSARFETILPSFLSKQDVPARLLLRTGSIHDCEADGNPANRVVLSIPLANELAIRSIDLALLFYWLEPGVQQGKSRRSSEVNYKTWTVGIAVLAMATAPAFAEPGQGQWSYDQNVVPVGCDSCCGDDCCGDGCCDCGSGCCGGSGLFSGMGPGIVEGMSLSAMLGIDAWDVGGWTQFGWTDDTVPLSPQGSNGSLGSFLDSPNRFNLHQQWFYVGKEADGSCGFDVGFRADVIYGVDAQKTQSFGNPGAGTPGFGTFDASLDHGTYGWAIPQLYGEVAMGDLSFKIGHFFTLIGYEVVPAPQNFFFSHSLTMFNSEPFTHTGVMSKYSGFENMTLYGGWTLGWDTGFDNVNSGNSFLGGFSVDLLDAVSLSAFSSYGNFGAINTGGDTDNQSSSVVFDVTVTDSLNYVFQTDYKKIDNISDEDIGINQYLFYNFNDAVSFGTRIEWWRNDQVSNYEYTTGVNIKLLDNLVIRPEYRQDWIPATDFSVNNTACDMILTY